MIIEPSDFVPGKCYKVYFEKDIPIEFKFIKKDTDGNLVCQKQTGQQFNFYNLPQHLKVQTVYPEW